MSLFDPTSFLSSAITSSLSTKRTPLPIGETYGQITKVDSVSGEKNGRPWYKLNVTFEITDHDYLSQATGQPEKALLTYGILVEMEHGTLAMGPNKNVKLGRLREAAGVNQPGKSLNDLTGRVCRLSIGHRPDPNDSSVVYDEIKDVAKY